MSVAFGMGSWSMLMLLLFGGGGMGLPLGIPPLPEDPVLAQLAPEECLFYVSWAGTAQPDAESANQTEQLLAEPEVRLLVDEVERLVSTGLRKAAAEEGPQAAAMAEDALRWGKVLLTRPAALFVSKVAMTPGGPDVRAGAVLNVGDAAAQLKDTLEIYQQKFLQGAAQRVQIGGDTWHRITLDPDAPAITWGVRGQHLIVGVGEQAIEGTLERLGGGAPEWLSQIRAELPVERRSTLAYINVQAIRTMLLSMVPEPMVGRVVEALGLGNVTSLASVTGLDQTGFVKKTLIGLDGEPQGLFRLAAAEPLDPSDLAPIPGDATLAVACRLDAENVLDTVLSVAGKIHPEAREELLEGLGEMQEELGFDLRRDLLQPLGDTWCVYNSPGEGGLVITGLTAVVQVKDRRRLATAHARFLALMRQEFGTGRYSPRIDQFDFAGQTVYVFNAREDDFPVAPSWCLTDEALVIAPFPQNIKAYLGRGADHQSIAGVPAVAEMFQPEGGPISLCYVDTPALFKLVYPFVPMLAQAVLGELSREGIDVSVSLLPSAAAIGKHLRPGVGALRRTRAGIEIVSHQSLPGGNVGASLPLTLGALIPAVHSARGAAYRAHSVNNMKQIAIALHNYHDVYKTLPPAYTTDEDGKPLLSWRVLILPFVEQQALYDQFHLDEPWDSEHNKRLIQVVVPTYRAPDSHADPGRTNYLGVGGKQGIFSGDKPTGFRDIRDGTSNTIMVVEVGDPAAVIWTKPDDFQPDPENPKRGLFGLRPGGFNAGFADGSVLFLNEMIPDEALRAMFTRDGAEPVRRDAVYAR